MTGLVHLCMFTLLCNLVNTFLSIMCGHFYLVFILLPEDMTISKGEADQGDSQDKGELHND